MDRATMGAAAVGAMAEPVAAAAGPAAAEPADGRGQQLAVSLVRVSPVESEPGHGLLVPEARDLLEVLLRRRPHLLAQTTAPIISTTSSTQRKIA